MTNGRVKNPAFLWPKESPQVATCSRLDMVQERDPALVETLHELEMLPYEHTRFINNGKGNEFVVLHIVEGKPRYSFSRLAASGR